MGKNIDFSAGVGDSISRQAAIDALEEDKRIINAAIDSLELDFRLRTYETQRREQIESDIRTIKELPPAERDEDDH